MSFGKALQDFKDKNRKRKGTKPGEVGLDIFDRARRAEKERDEKKKNQSKMEQFANKLYGGS
tara:strand:+ start:180 stop:365 length:186 start_codon:yes stop_codon:yes gene_type:complete